MMKKDVQSSPFKNNFIFSMVHFLSTLSIFQGLRGSDTDG